MDDPDINAAALEEMIRKAVEGDQEALAALLYSGWLRERLDQIAKWAWLHYEVEADEHGRSIADVVSDKIRDKISSLKNPNNRPWRERLTQWCYTVAKYHCLNVIRHRGVVQRHVADVEYQYTEGFRDGKRVIVPSSPMPSPEEEVERQEREALVSKFYRTARLVSASCTPQEAEILRRWLDGMTLHEIADAVGSSAATVQRKLKKLQQALITSVIAEVEQAMVDMRRDEVEIRRLKQEARAILDELAA